MLTMILADICVIWIFKSKLYIYLNISYVYLHMYIDVDMKENFDHYLYGYIRGLKLRLTMCMYECASTYIWRFPKNAGS